MSGSALVVQGTDIYAPGKVVTTNTDPTVKLQTDNTASVPYERGDGHLFITVKPGGVEWYESQNNIYYWNGSNFNSLSTPQGSSQAPPGTIIGCANLIAVGPNSRGLTNGTPWTIGCHQGTDGNRSVLQMQTGGAWVHIQDDIAQQIAVSPEDHAWVINVAGAILYWNGSEFVANPTGGCATSIGVGPNSHGLSNGTPWVTSCNVYADGNRTVYQMQTDGTWVKMQSDVATQVAVSPEGNGWAINAAGDILYWNGSKFVANPTGGCATSIAVGPNSHGLSNGTPWVTSCSTSADGNHAVYQMQTDGVWVEMQSDVGIQIAVSPEGNPWAVSRAGVLRKNTTQPLELTLRLQ